ncbi:MAG TPA: hypothetical protein VF777_01065 [Phycisphaerales bacterium]
MSTESNQPERPAQPERRAADAPNPTFNPQTGVGLGYSGVVDRRLGLDRREIAKRNGTEDPTGLERRRGRGRRLSDFTKSAEEGEMTKEQFLFLSAIDAFKKANGKTFPTWTDVLEVVRLLGYRKTCKAEMHLRNAEDWMEAADTPSNVRPQRWHEREKIDRDRRAA